MLSKDAAPKAAKDSLSRTNNTTPNPAQNDCRFPDTVRLGGRTALLRVIRDGKRISSAHLGLSYVADDTARIGVGVSKSTGNAVKRNRAKRIIREYLRQNKSLWPKYKSVFVRLRTKPSGEKEIIEELRTLLAKI
jgi:ribonuclease P protein component